MRSKQHGTLVNAIGSLLIMAYLMQMTACSRKPVRYFRISSTSKYTTLIPQEITIQKSDILSIAVYSDNAGSFNYL